jgi:hypothetical protein
MLRTPIAPEVNSLIERMFVDTADNNYIIARSAFLSHRFIDFYWMTSHAIEKYLKAILLYHNQSVKKHNHKIISLYERVLSIDRRICIEPFIDPCISEISWSAISVIKFLEKLEIFGDANNRYNDSGYHVRGEDLLKSDWVIWSIRRFCYPPYSVIITENGNKKIDWINEVILNHSVLSNFSNRPIEKIIKKRDSDILFDGFRRSNKPFFPSESINPFDLVLSSSTWTTFAMILEDMKSCVENSKIEDFYVKKNTITFFIEKTKTHHHTSITEMIREMENDLERNSRSPNL